MLARILSFSTAEDPQPVKNSEMMTNIFALIEIFITISYQKRFEVLGWDSDNRGCCPALRAALIRSISASVARALCTSMGFEPIEAFDDYENNRDKP